MRLHGMHGSLVWDDMGRRSDGVVYIEWDGMEWLETSWTGLSETEWLGLAMTV